jgi:hypothetical protein
LVSGSGGSDPEGTPADEQAESGRENLGDEGLDGHVGFGNELSGGN